VSTFEITVLSKDGGPLTKSIMLRDGTVGSDGSACVMSRGSAERVHLESLKEFACFIDDLESNRAIALGALRDDLPSEVSVVTKAKLSQLNGSAGLDTIARSSTFISYRSGQPALALIDFDKKGHAARRSGTNRGPWRTLESNLCSLSESGVVRTRHQPKHFRRPAPR
jgi:hypothetical protein